MSPAPAYDSAGTAPATLWELFARTRAAFPDRPALVTATGRWSYRELGERVERYTEALIASGAGKGTRIGLLLENRPEWIALALAATGIGAWLVPVSTFVHREDLAWHLRHADVAQLYMGARFLKRDYLHMLREIAPQLEHAAPGALYCPALPALRRVCVLGAEDLPPGAEPWSVLEAPPTLARGLVDAMRAETDDQDECYLLYTSGTTAVPKGVLHTHAAVAGNGWWIGEYQGLQAEDVVWFYFPLFFSAGCINVMLGTLSHGAALILQPSFEPGEALALIERERATTWHLWPHMLDRLMKHTDWHTRDHSRLHKGTGPFDVILERPAPDGLGGVHMYGMTETCTAFTCTRADDAPAVRLHTQGRPLPGNVLRIVDPQTGAEVARGTAGEICVRGPAVLRRYYKHAPGDVLDAGGWFHTGDSGFVDVDGRLHFTHRLKDMIKVGGINVSPAQVEAKLVQLPGVAQAHVFALPGAAGDQAVGAALVPAPEARLQVESIGAWCAANLPGYQRPRAVLVVSANELPVTGSGKVRKVALREWLEAALARGQGPVVCLAPARGLGDGPRSDTERETQ